MAQPEATGTEFVTTRVPKDVLRMMGVLASLDDKNVSEWNNTDLREWVTKRYRARLSREGKSVESFEV